MQRKHATFLYLDITIEDDIFVYELFEKTDKFPFPVRMPHLLSNIPSRIVYDSILSAFLRKARYTLRLTHFIPRAF